MALPQSAASHWHRWHRCIAAARLGPLRFLSNLLWTWLSLPALDFPITPHLKAPWCAAYCRARPCTTSSCLGSQKLPCMEVEVVCKACGKSYAWKIFNHVILSIKLTDWWMKMYSKLIISWLCFLYIILLLYIYTWTYTWWKVIWKLVHQISIDKLIM